MEAETANTGDRFFTIKEAAAKLAISERSLRLFLRRGEVNGLRLGQRIIRVSQREIERLAATGLQSS